MDLKILREGKNVDGDSGNPMDILPDWMDRDRFRRGQQFFVRHLAGTVLALLCSLTLGFSITGLLNALVFTGRSDQPATALRRYVETLVHVFLWHTTDVWDAKSAGYRSLESVRGLHGKVASAMNRDHHKDKVHIAVILLYNNDNNYSHLCLGYI
jgi:hypothetical protein